MFDLEKFHGEKFNKFVNKTADTMKTSLNKFRFCVTKSSSS
jgi:hypothetical protein